MCGASEVRAWVTGIVEQGRIDRMGQVIRALATTLGTGVLLGLSSTGGAQQHGRKYQPPPPTAHVVVTVLKAFNGKPFPNAGVVFHAIRNGKDDGNLEVKTDPDGHATIDVLEQGSHVLLQVIASGFATYASQFDLTGPTKEMTVRLQRPRAQISTYMDNDGKAAQAKPGVQEHIPGTLPKTTENPQ
jgi:hypothetical protein